MVIGRFPSNDTMLIIQLTHFPVLNEKLSYKNSLS